MCKEPEEKPKPKDEVLEIAKTVPPGVLNVPWRGEIGVCVGHTKGLERVDFR